MRPFTPFTSNDEIAAIARALADRTLPKPAWTHAAHFASALWLFHAEVEFVREMPGMIRAYNEATGVANTDTSGYHETITMASLRAARAFLREDSARPLFDLQRAAHFATRRIELAARLLVTAAALFR